MERYYGAFEHDAFGRGAERAARFFGTPAYLVGQTVAVIVWVALNSLALTFAWDKYPFIPEPGFSRCRPPTPRR